MGRDQSGVRSEIVDGDKQVIPLIGGFLPFEQRQPFGVEMHQLSGVGFIVAFGLLFKFS